jgi:hypothetical protein
MKRAILMSTIEPTDSQLSELMHEVAVEAKQKALLSQKQLTETIKQLVLKAIEKK